MLVGIPRGLLYYYYGDVWEEFFRRLGAEPVVSRETDWAMLEAGGCVDEVCLPVKAFFGHVRSLAGRVDVLFVPRVVSMAAGAYSCPKIIGLPDIIRSTVPDAPPLIDVTVNMRRDRLSLWRAAALTGARLGKSAPASLYAWWRALGRAAGAGRAGSAAPEQGLRVALIGHPYILRDRRISLDIAGKLAAMGVGVCGGEEVAFSQSEREASRLPKQIFWHYCRQLAGAALAQLYSPRPPDGMILVTSFACGPDSLVGEVIKRRAAGQGVPFLLLTLDEHTAEAGLVTRLEAFVDMLARRGRR